MSKVASTALLQTMIEAGYHAPIHSLQEVYDFSDLTEFTKEGEGHAGKSRALCSLVIFMDSEEKNFDRRSCFCPSAGATIAPQAKIHLGITRDGSVETPFY